MPHAKASSTTAGLQCLGLLVAAALSTLSIWFLDSLGVAGFFMSCLLNSSGDIDTFQLLGVEALFLLHGRALLADIIGSGTISFDLQRTFSPLNLILNRFLRNLASSLLDISTGLVRDISALLSGHRLVGGLGNLVADFLGHLTTNWLRWSRSLLAGIELVGDVGESQEKRYDNEELHLDRYF